MRLRSYFQIFLLQSVLMIVMTTPIVVFMQYRNSTGVTITMILGMLIWAEGMIFESLGDWQLNRFLKRKKSGTEKSEVLDTGVWAWTRHPNYFGEIELWWGIATACLVIAVPITWIGYIAAIFITLSIRFLSGIPLLEKELAQSEEYREYMENVPMLFPRIPRRNK
jgi:steroid 5-alpha reductase family enzyme